MNNLLYYFCGGIVVADEDTTTGAVEPGFFGRSILLGNVLATVISFTFVFVTGRILVPGN